MTKISKRVSYELTVRELEKLLAEHVAKDASKDAKIMVSFDIGTEYDYYDRGPGYPVLTGATVTVVEP